MATPRNRAIALGLLGAVLFTGCSSRGATPVPTASMDMEASPGDTTPGPLEGPWIVTAVNDQPLPDGVSATMAFKGSQVSGNAGCNSYSASVDADMNGHLTFGPIASTLMACEGDAAQAEAAFFKAMEETQGYQGGDPPTDLSLVDDSGAQLIAITKGTPAA